MAQWRAGAHASGSRHSDDEWKRDPSGQWHFVGKRGGGGGSSSWGSASSSWQCGGCLAWTWAPKTKCTTCGMRKSYAQALIQGGPPQQHADVPPTTAVQSKPKNVSQQLSQVATLLSSAAGVPGATAAVTAEAAPPAAPASLAPPSASPPTSSGTCEVSSPVAPTKAQLQKQIKELEQAHACLSGPVFADQRAGLQKEIEACKRQISEARPIGQRIDGVRDALGRAKKRAAHAEEAAKLAEEAMRQAATDVEKLTAELTQLENSVGHGEAEKSGDAVLKALEDHLQMAVEVLKEANVGDAAVAEARSQAVSFYKRFVSTLDYMNDPPRRLQGKQPPVSPPAPAPMYRHRSKAPLRRTKPTTFIVNRKIAKSKSPSTFHGADSRSAPV